MRQVGWISAFVTVMGLFGACLESGTRLDGDAATLPDGGEDDASGPGDGDGTGATPDASAPDTSAPDDKPDAEPPDPADTGGDKPEVVAPQQECGCGFGEACANPCKERGFVCAREGYADGSETRYCREPAQVGEGCANQFDEYAIPCARGLACLVPDPNEDDTASVCFDCAPQRFEVRGECEAEIGVFWDGRECRSYSGCRCQGPDCDAAYGDIEACLERVGRACAALVDQP